MEHVRRHVLRVTLDEHTGVVRLRIRSRDAELAHRMATVFVERLAEYLKSERNVKAREHLAFIESSRADASRSLADAA